MFSRKCIVCNKVIEGFTKKDLDYKMLMHNIKHRNIEQDDKEETEEN